MKKRAIKSIILLCLSGAIITLILCVPNAPVPPKQQPAEETTEAQEPVSLINDGEIQVGEAAPPNSDEPPGFVHIYLRPPDVPFEMDDLSDTEKILGELETEQDSQPSRNARYASITLTAAERRDLAACILIEAGSEPSEGQQAVAEVVFNRVLNDSFPNNVHEVLHFGEDTDVPQFSSVHGFDYVWPGQAQYDAIERALYGEHILDEDVVFFSRSPANDRVWGTIGNHVFCRENVWNQTTE